MPFSCPARGPRSPRSKTARWSRPTAAQCSSASKQRIPAEHTAMILDNTVVWVASFAFPCTRQIQDACRREP